MYSNFFKTFSNLFKLFSKLTEAKFTAEIVPGFEKGSTFHLFFVAGGGTFELRHGGNLACAIPDEDTIVMTGGRYPIHDYVTR